MGAVARSGNVFPPEEDYDLSSQNLRMEVNSASQPKTRCRGRLDFSGHPKHPSQGRWPKFSSTHTLSANVLQTSKNSSPRNQAKSRILRKKRPMSSHLASIKVRLFLKCIWACLPSSPSEGQQLPTFETITRCLFTPKLQVLESATKCTVV